MSGITNTLQTFSGTATLDFGAAPGTNYITLNVTGQSAILSTSNVSVYMMTDTTVSGSAGHNSIEHALLASKISLTAGNIIPGVGFTISAITDLRLTSTIKVRWSYS